MPDKIYNHKIIAAVRDFTEKPVFPVLVGAAAFLCYCLCLPITAILLLGLPVIFTFFFNRDTRPALGVVLLAVLTLRYMTMLSSYLSAYAIAVYALIGSGVIAGLVCRFIWYGKISGSNKIWQGLALVSVAILVGGAFGGYWTTFNIASSLGIAAGTLSVTLIFGYTMKRREDNLVYLARILVIAAVTISLQLAEFYIKNYDGQELNGVWKASIATGWGISNLVGEMIAFLMPAIFFLACREKHGYLYNFAAVVCFVAVYFTLGRNALIWASAVMLVGFTVNCFVGKNKLGNRIFAAAFVIVLGAAVAVLVKSGVMERLATFFTTSGFNDRGRFAIWREWLTYFKENPLLGKGVAAYRTLHPGEPMNAHNTLIQMLGGCGLMGTVLYLYHRMQTVQLLTKKPTLDRIYFGSTFVVGVGLSLIDPLFFQVYFAFFYAAVLLVLEKDADETTETETPSSKPDKP